MIFTTVRQCQEYVQVLIDTINKVQRLPQEYIIDDNGNISLNFIAGFAFNKTRSIGWSSADIKCNDTVKRIYFHKPHSHKIEIRTLDLGNVRYETSNVIELSTEITEEYLFQQSLVQNASTVSAMLFVSALRQHPDSPAFISFFPENWHEVIRLIDERL